MSFADSFRGLDFLEQAHALQELKSKTPAEAISELMPLFTEPSHDTAANSLVRSSLRSFLQLSDDAVIAGLDSPLPAYAALCQEIAGNKRLVTAAPILLKKIFSAPDSESLHETLTTLGAIGTPDALPAFRQHLNHPDMVISAFCIQHIGQLNDSDSLPALSNIILANDAENRYDTCDITTWQAIEALGTIGVNGTDAALTALAGFMHHRNPTARRIVLETLVRCGEVAIPHVTPALLDKDTDNCIMAANTLRDIAHKSAAAPLIDALEKGAARDANVGFAIYEALGHTPGVKSLVALTDALPKEKEPSTIMAVVQALEMLASPAVGKRVLEIIADRMAAQDTQAQRVLHAVVSSHATRIFPYLYADPVIGRILMSLILKSADVQTMEAFKRALSNCDTAAAARDIESITKAMPKSDSGRPRLLAIDDSAAMRSFYRTHGATIGFEVTLAEHGQNALDIVEALDGIFDVIVVDMNMPVMDGIQFTEKLRSMPIYANTPVIMATTESARSQASLARKSGVSSFLPKPFTPEILQLKLNKILDRAKG